MPARKALLQLLQQYLIERLPHHVNDSRTRDAIVRASYDVGMAINNTRRLCPLDLCTLVVRGLDEDDRSFLSVQTLMHTLYHDITNR